jgi:Dehydrogenases with different specificities (related to short-chain alcohol dehydrogenases)
MLGKTDLSGRAVLISGATGGLGKVATRQFLEAGAVVAGISRSWQGKDLPPGQFFPIEADLSSPSGADSAVQQAASHLGRIDVVLHLMGGYAGGRLVQETDDATWRRMLDLNLNSTFYLARAAMPRLIESQSGRIIAVSSRAAVDAPARSSAYTVSKAGVLALIRTIAAEGKAHGVTANAVLPGTIDTEANRAAMPGADFSKWVKPESIANLLLWLASEASGDVSGALIPIYGRS